MFLQKKDAPKVLFMCYYSPENVFATHLLSRLFAACFSHICSLFFCCCLLNLNQLHKYIFVSPIYVCLVTNLQKISILFWKAWDPSQRQAHVIRDGSLLNRICEHCERASETESSWITQGNPSYQRWVCTDLFRI